jgi:hypothetical protein
MRGISLCSNNIFQLKTAFSSKEIPRSSRGMTGAWSCESGMKQHNLEDEKGCSQAGKIG